MFRSGERKTDRGFTLIYNSLTYIIIDTLGETIHSLYSIHATTGQIVVLLYSELLAVNSV